MDNEIERRQKGDFAEHFTPRNQPEIDSDLKKQLRSGANWFYWIGAMSIVNTIVIQFNGNWNFVIGLGMTQIIDGFTLSMESSLKMIPLIISVLFSLVFVLFGYFSNKGISAVFITGMVIYALDGLLFLLIKDWLSIGFHVFALFWIFKGLKANMELKKLAIDSKLNSIKNNEPQLDELEENEASS